MHVLVLYELREHRAVRLRSTRTCNMHLIHTDENLCRICTGPGRKSGYGPVMSRHHDGNFYSLYFSFVKTKCRLSYIFVKLYSLKFSIFCRR